MHVFDWVVSGINSSIAGSDGSSKLQYIGLLDIFGFEVFKYNSFEQLCINFTNEKLQQFFLQAVFRAEEEEHANQGVALSKIEIQDNQPCIDLLESKKPAGIFALLDSQCKTPNGSEAQLCTDINTTHSKSTFLAPTRTAKLRDTDGFIVRHFAGNVTYHSSVFVSNAAKSAEVPWLEKNNDALDAGWLQKLAHSSVGLLSNIYKPELEAAKAKKPALSVGKRFTGNVKELLDELGSVRPFFIRCIKPNMEKVAKVFTVPLVLEQLRCSGLMGAVKLMQEAYPTRVAYTAILEACEKAVGKETVQAIKCHPAVFCEKVLQAMVDEGLSKGDVYAIGKSKLFLKAGGGAFLQDMSKVSGKELVDSIRKKLEASRRSMSVIVRVAHIYSRWKKKTFDKKFRAIVRLQHAVRSRLYRKQYKAWCADRIVKAAAKMQAQNEEARKAAMETELKERMAAAEQMEAQIKAAEIAKIEQSAREQKETTIKAQRGKLVSKACWRIARAHYRGGATPPEGAHYPSVEAQLSAPTAILTLEIAEQRAEDAVAEEIAEAERVKTAAIEERRKGIEESLRGEVFDGATPAATTELAERFQQATGKPPPSAASPSKKKRNVTISAPGGEISVPGASSSFTLSSHQEAVEAPKPIKAAGPPKADGRSRQRTLAGYFALSEGETFEVVLETEDHRDGVGIAVEVWNGELVILSMAPGGCADEEGTLMVGDAIRSIDGVPCETAADCQRLLRGRPGKQGRYPSPAAAADATEEGEQSTEQAPAAAATAPPKPKWRSQGPRGRGAERAYARAAPAPLVQDENGIYRAAEKEWEGERLGCEYVLEVTRRPLIFTLRSEVKLRMPTGAWEAFMAEVRSNRTVMYEQIEAPNSTGEVLLEDLLGVSQRIEVGEKVLQIYTRHKVIDMKPESKDFKAWHLRLQELLLTREEAVHRGWMHKERPLAVAEDKPATTRASSRSRANSAVGPSGRVVDLGKFVHYYFVLYANGALLYFSDPDSAHLGQARGYLPVATALLTSKAKRKLAAGDSVWFTSSKWRTSEMASIVAERPKGKSMHYTVKVEGAEKPVDVAPTSLRYWFEGADAEPAACVDDRGIAVQRMLTLEGGSAECEERWLLGVDDKAQSEAWFATLLKHRAPASVAQPTVEQHASSDPTFEDVVLASGFIDINAWAAELSASQVDKVADDLARIRSIAAGILAMQGNGDEQFETESQFDNAFDSEYVA